MLVLKLNIYLYLSQKNPHGLINSSIQPENTQLQPVIGLFTLDILEKSMEGTKARNPEPKLPFAEVDTF